MINYSILASGSSGNCTIIESEIMLDAGVPYKVLLPYIRTLRIVLLTHVHSDHFNKSTISALARERPSLRFVCGEWLYDELLKCGVFKFQVDRLYYHERAAYKSDSNGVSGCSIVMEQAVHDVPNAGYKICLPSGERIFYMTDTSTLDGIIAKNYDLYLIENNYEDTEIQERIDAKLAKGEFAYEYRVRRTHLSKQKCDEWLSRNKGDNSKIEYLHRHI